MKDSEFIELLNLYLDHEISAADAARLEAEVQTNLARRKIYRQYCRMQKACRVLATDFQTELAPSAPAVARNVIPFDPAVAASAPRRRIGPIQTVGALAVAAACVAVIFAGRQRPAAPVSAGPSPVVQSAPIKAFDGDAKPTMVSHPTTPRGGLVSVAGQRAQAARAQATLVGNSLLLTANAPGDAALATAMQQADDQLEWIRNLQLSPLQQRVQAETFRFGLQPTVLRPEARTLGIGQSPAEGPIESVGFQFSK